MRPSKRFKRIRDEIDIRAKLRGLGVDSAGQLIAVCKDSKRSVSDRALSCLLLGQVGDRDVVRELLRIAESSNEPLLVWESLSAVARSGAGLRPPLIELLGSTLVPVRRARRCMLSMSGMTKALMTLVTIVRDARDDVSALGKLRLRRWVCYPQSRVRKLL